MPVSKKNKKIAEALSVLVDLGMPRAQQNERSALALLALLNLTADKAWSEAQDPLMGITPIMDWARKHYNKRYAPNTRETVRRQTMHQFVQAGTALYNPDQPDRPVNSHMRFIASNRPASKFCGRSAPNATRNTSPNI